MRILQLAIGWLALCGLTAAGTYYAMIEVDQQVGLQARVAQRVAASVTPAPIGTTPPSLGPPSTTNPVTTTPGPATGTPAPVPTLGSPASGTPATGTPSTGTPVTGPPTTTVPVTPPPVAPPVRRPPPSTTPPAADPTPPPPVAAPRVNLGPIQARFNELYERAKDLDAFYGQREAELRQQGMQLNSSMRTARTAMAQYINAAAAAIRTGNAAGATQALNMAEPKIQYLEEQK